LKHCQKWCQQTSIRMCGLLSASEDFVDGEFLILDGHFMRPALVSGDRPRPFSNSLSPSGRTSDSGITEGRIWNMFFMYYRRVGLSYSGPSDIRLLGESSREDPLFPLSPWTHEMEMTLQPEFPSSDFEVLEFLILDLFSE
jgi:hypothetical protein